MLHIELLYNPAIELQEKGTHTSTQKLVHEWSLAALFILAKKWKQPKYPSTDELIKCSLSIKWIII